MEIQISQKQKETVNQSTIKKGKATFKILFPDEAPQELSSQDFIKKQLSDSKWLITQERYKYNHWHQIFKIMLKCQPSKIWLDWNMNSNILKDINHIQFQKLKFLSLSGNLITNIEALNQMDCIKLQGLSLDCNLISRISNMKKTHFSSINELYLYDNPISKINNFDRILIKSSIIEIVTLQMNKCHSQIQEDISFFFKSQAKKIGILYLNGNKRLRQTKIKAMMSKRFEDIALKF